MTDGKGSVNLISKEGDVYEVPIYVAKMSNLVRETLDEEDEGIHGDDDDVDDDDNDNLEGNSMGMMGGGPGNHGAEIKDVPLPNVSANILTKVIDFAKHYQTDPMTPIQTPLKSNKLEELVQPWYAEFVRVPRNILFELVAAANFMDIKALLDLTCLAVAILIKGKSASELREMFNISPTDYSREDEGQLQESSWTERPPQG